MLNKLTVFPLQIFFPPSVEEGTLTLLFSLDIQGFPLEQAGSGYVSTGLGTQVVRTAPATGLAPEDRNRECPTEGRDPGMARGLASQSVQKAPPLP